MGESNTHMHKDELYTSDGSAFKLIEKIKDVEIVNDNGTVIVNRSKYKKLEIPMFVGENLDLGCTC